MRFLQSLIETDPIESKKGHLHSVDGLRGIAIIMVVVFHTLEFRKVTNPFLIFPAALNRSGWFGVYIFFVLSGLLISRPFFKSRLKNEKFSIGTYAIRRLAKIIPPCFLAITFAGAKALWISHPHDLGQRVLGSFFFSYSLTGQAPLPGVLWTLGIEAWFYLLLPLAFLCCQWMQPRAAIYTIIGLFMVIPMIAKMITVVFPSGADYFLGSTLFTMQFFAWGMIFAYLHLTFSEEVLRWISRPLFWVGATTLFAICLTVGLIGLPLSLANFEALRWGTAGRIWFSPVVGLSCFLLLFSTVQPRSGLYLFLNSRALVFIGTISYEWYLFHTTFMYAGNSNGSLSKLIFYSIIPCLISFVFAAYLYLYFSLPILSYAHRRAPSSRPA